MTFRPLAPLRRSCGLVEVTRVRDGEELVARGTAYVVEADRVVTCAHIVQAKAKVDAEAASGDPHPIRVIFRDGDDVVERTAVIAEIDGDADYAVLKLNDPVPFPALPLAEDAPADMMRWAGFGATSVELRDSPAAPDNNRPGTIPVPTFGELDGVIISTHATDRRGESVLTLLAPKVAEEAATHGNALAGSPVIVNQPSGWVVVGHLREPVIAPNTLATPLAGLLSATPAGIIRKALELSDAGWKGAPTLPYHAFLSIREADRPWAEELEEALQAAGFRVYLTSHETAKETELSHVEVEALSSARAAILVYSHAWEGSAHREETEALRNDDNSTQTLVVRLGGAALPGEYTAYPTFDFDSQSSPDGEPLDRLKAKLVVGTAAGMRGLTRPWEMIEHASATFAKAIRSARRNPETLLLLARAWRDSGMPGEEVPRRAARALVDSGKPDAALKLLDQLGSGRSTPRVERVRALALLKSKQTDKAIDLLEDLRKDGQLDARTAAQFASAYKQKWLETGGRRASLLTKSYEAYSESYERDPEGYRGINVATTAWFMGDKKQSRTVATKVLQSVLADPSELDKWNKAVLGEAYLLLGFDHDATVEWYRRAALEAKLGDVVTMRKQARLIIDTFENDEQAAELRERIDAALYVPGLVGFAGPSLREGTPFPPSRARFITRSLGKIVAAHDVEIGMCTLGSESDVLFAESVLKYGGRLEAHLPFHPAGVRTHLIAPHWHSRFDAVLRSPRTSIKALSADTASEEALGLAVEAALERLIDAVMHEGAVLDDDAAHFVVVRHDSTDSEHIGAAAAQAWADEGRGEHLTQIFLDGSAGSPPAALPSPGEPDEDAADVPASQAESDEDSPDPARSAAPQTRTFGHAVKSARSEASPAESRLESGNYKNRHAVVVGIDAYDEWVPLGNAVSDALGFSSAIQDFGFASQIVLTNDMATVGKIREAIEDEMVAKVEPDDLFVLFFAGHGHTINDSGFLVPVEASRQLSKASTLIGMEQVLGWVKKLRSRHVLYIFDACFSGSATLDAGISMPGKSGDARYSITAGTATQEVLDGGGEDGHSVFTTALLEGLRTIGGPDQRFSALHLYSHIEAEVRNKAGDQQTPSFGTLPGHGGGLIWFQKPAQDTQGEAEQGHT